MAGSERVGTVLGWATGFVSAGLRPATDGGIERTVLERTVRTDVMDSSAEIARAGWTSEPGGHTRTWGTDRRVGAAQAGPG